MRKKYHHIVLKPYMVLFLPICFFLFSVNYSFSQIRSEKLIQLGNLEEAKYEDVKNAMNEIWAKDTSNKKAGWKPYKRWENFWETRLMPDGSYPNIINLFNEFNIFKESQNKKESLLSGKNKWTAIGPFNRTELDERFSSWVTSISNNLGRINVVRFHPKNKNEIWVGTASGGLWKSTNSGETWINFPFTDYLSLGVSDIAFAPSFPNIVYLATGDHIAWAQTYSIGVIKSTDGGNTWQITNLIYKLSEMAKICKILIHPKNPNNVIAATSKGIYKTTDGGLNWYEKSYGYFKDMIFMPENPDVVLATTYSQTTGTGIFRSDNNGNSWQLVYQLPDVARTSLAVTKANPSKVYALCTKLYYYSFHSLLVSTDEGQSFSIMSDFNNSPNILGWQGDGSDFNKGQAWYDLCLNVSPTNENEVFSGGVNIWKSSDGGVIWELATTSDSIYKKPVIHVDQHEIVFKENTEEMYVANDGGLYKTTDYGNSWDYLSDGMNITQFYRMGCNASNPEHILAGCQDNGTKMMKSDKWLQVGGADGMEAICDYSNPDIIYVSAQSGLLGRVNTATAEGKIIGTPAPVNESAAWTTPFVMSPQNPAVLYAGYINVWKTTDRGDNWQKLTNFQSSSVLFSLAVSPTDSNYIYAATALQLYMTSDGGFSWTELKTFASPITYIAVSYTNPEIIWISHGGFNEYVKVSNYDGKNWIDLTGNLPNVPVNTIVVQKDTPEILYIGTDIGVFTSFGGSGLWEIYGEGLPNVIISELEIQYSAKKLRASTYGLGLWETDIADLSSVNISGDSDKLVLIVPNPSSRSYEFQYSLDNYIFVKIDIFHLNGSKITTLVDAFQEAGRHNAVFDVGTQQAVSLQSGMYYYRIQIGDIIESGKLLLIK